MAHETLIDLMTTLYLPGIGAARLRKWIEQFGDIKTFYSINAGDLRSLGLSDEQINAIKNPAWAKVEHDLKWCEKNNCHLLTYTDARYPKLLNEIHSAPLVLFIQGQIESLLKPQLAIVGSRNPTIVGLESARHFANYLSQAGWVITSGLALGIDAAAHCGALDAKGQTIAVCGTGLKYSYPASHKKLANNIIENGALVSEFPPHTPPKARHFPLRNRLMSGLSLGVIVIEAAIKSGSLITAQFALEQGREVFALPGSIHNPLSRGCHKLIREGAKLVETAAHIVEELGALKAVIGQSTQKTFNLQPEQRDVLKQIGYEITALDAIIKRSGLTIEQVSSMLILLELEGYVTSVPGGYLRVN